MPANLISFWQQPVLVSPSGSSQFSIPIQRRLQTTTLQYNAVGDTQQVLLEMSAFPNNGVDLFQLPWTSPRTFIIDYLSAFTGDKEIALPVVYDDFGNAYYLPTPELSALAQDAPREVFTFDVNPNNVKVVMKKLEHPIRTLGGWEVQEWGEDTGTLTLIGKIVNLMFDENQQVVTRIQDSTGYKKFLRLRAIYTMDQSTRYAEDTYRIGVLYRNDVYVGHFDNFDYSESDTEPFAIDFNLTATIEQIIGSRLNIAQQQETRLARDLQQRQMLETWQRERGLP